MKILLFITLFVINISDSFSYVISRAPNGAKQKWNNGVQALTVYVNLTNSNSDSNCSLAVPCTDFNVFNVLEKSIKEWNNHSKVSTSVISVNDGPSNNRNDLYFSNDSKYFSGTGVLAVTNVVYSEATGEIFEADIILNDSSLINWNLDENSVNYLGHTVTHEFGHFLGLGHSEVKTSSMFYSISGGEFKLSGDDKAGIFSHYPSGTKGRIYGKVIGGNSKIGVFGAHVQAISTLTGEISGASISEDNGQFIIDGLPLNDTYYIYIEPSERLQSLPPIYASIQNNFCNTGGSYRGSFYQSCLSTNTGFPTGVEITSSSPSKSLGEVTIRCSLDVPGSYFKDKYDNVQTQFTLGTTSTNKGEAMVGYFSVNDIKTSNSDEFYIDYSQYPINTSNLYFDIKLTGHSLGDQFMEYLVNGVRTYQKVDLSLKVNGVTVNKVIEDDFVTNDDRRYRVPLDASTVNNIFNIEVIPSVTGGTSSANSYNKEFRDNLIFYLMTISIVKKEADDSYTLYDSKKYINYSDNGTCPDASGTYFVPAKLQSSVNVFNFAESTNNDNESPVSCGTVDIDNGSGGGSGPLSFVIGFIIIMMLKKPKNKSIFSLD